MSLRMAALGLIAQHPRSTGYDLLKTFELSLANVWPATQSQLYGELNRLAGDGLIEVAATGPRGRKEYEITDVGHRELAAWLVGSELEPMRFQLMLKVFLISELGRDGAAAYMDAVGDGTRESMEGLEALRERVDWADDLDDVLGAAVLDWGLRLHRMQIEWAAATAARLRALKAG